MALLNPVYHCGPLKSVDEPKIRLGFDTLLRPPLIAGTHSVVMQIKLIQFRQREQVHHTLQTVVGTASSKSRRCQQSLHDRTVSNILDPPIQQ